MRIISGKHKGRRIELGKDAVTVRPTSEFAREAIFNILTHSKHIPDGAAYAGKQVLDVYCGTGAFGLEALSRGAAKVTFIDKAREALATTKHNVVRMHEEETTDFLLADATRLPRARSAYSLIFLDPPYFSKLIEPTLASLLAGGWIEKGGLIVVEHDAKEAITLTPEFEVLDERRYGRAQVNLLRFKE
ncbi:MAG: 16S rRNA (guanine(966)-N(2))-methyltransferase RsmD [Alphaproteobacteria bacterium]|nr:16S rRNA (guanine(966)-N(2))-methyltransferase RsmD [Alphaproteobacteria bacterium]